MLMILVLTASTSATVQQQPEVRIDIRLGQFDVLYLADFIDVTTGALSSNIPNASIQLETVPQQAMDMYLVVTVFIRLRGDQNFTQFVKSTTHNFVMPGRMTVTSRDLARTGGGNIRVKSTDVNSAMQRRLEDHVRTLPTAPVGTYAIEVEVYSPDNVRLARQRSDVDVSGATPEDVSVTYVEPQDGVVLPTLFPTFSWTTQRPQARISIYERLPFHRSPEDAVTGVPHLQMEVRGTSFTYPPDAARRLEPGKTYVWFLEVTVSTNRGAQIKRGPVFAFRTQALAGEWAFLERFLTGLGGEAAGTFATLQGMGWRPTGEIVVDGRTVTLQQLQVVLNQLAQRQQASIAAGAGSAVKITVQ
jgi:hypothetical protein